MRSDRPLILAVLLVAGGLYLLFTYGSTTTGMRAAFPPSDSTLHLEILATGSTVLGGLALTAVGALVLVWAFLAAIVGQISLLAGRDRVFERVIPKDGGHIAADPDAPNLRRRFWSRTPASDSN